MTCVIAIKEGGSVYMGADSAGSGGSYIRNRADPKIHIVGPFMFGFTTSFRMGQLLAHAFKAPDRDPRVPTDKFMATTFIDAVRESLKAGGWAKKDSESEQGGNFLVAYEGRIFNIFDDYQVGESLLPYESVGCGADIAMGSLFTTDNTKMTAVARIDMALRAAAEFSTGVRGPFIQMVMSTA